MTELYHHAPGFVPMEITSSAKAGEIAWKDITERMDGTKVRVATKYPKLDKVIKSDWNRVYVLGAMSGAGKSVTAKDLCDSIEEKNDVKPMFIYSNTEMIASDTFKRSAVTKSGITLDVMDSEEEPISKEQYEYLKNVFNKLNNRDNLFFSDEITTPEKIIASLRFYYDTQCRNRNQPLVFIMDHSLLMASSENLRSDKEKIDYLAVELIKLKKDVAKDGGRFIAYVLSQLNRDIKKGERVKDPGQHVPTTSDLFASSFLEQGADAVIAVHIPFKCGLEQYTMQNLPTMINVNGESLMMAYMHVIKNRHGPDGALIPLVNKLKYFSYEEMDKKLFEHILQQHQANGVCNLEF